MRTLLDVPPELRSLIFERISYQTLKNIGRACPSWLPELLGCVNQICGDNLSVLIPSSIIRDCSRLQIVQYRIFLDISEEDLRPLTQAHYLISSIPQGNKVLAQARTQYNQVTISTKDMSQIRWNSGTLTVELCGNVIPNLNLYLGEVKIKELILYDYHQRPEVIVGFVLAILSQGISHSQYVNRESEELAEMSAYHLATQLETMFFNLAARSEFPAIKQLIFPTRSVSLQSTLRVCPNVTKLGLICSGRLENIRSLQDIMDRYPHITFVLFIMEELNQDLKTFIKGHPRLELAV